MPERVIAADAQGRLRDREPVAVVDIGSNSVRLVVYEGITRSPWVLFNEKVMCGLGRGVAATGRLPEDGVALALETLRRFHALAEQSRVASIHALATAAARDAENGPEFIERAEAILGAPIRLISGEEEARYAALAVVSGIHGADGLVGDLGGGSLELTRVEGGTVAPGVSLPLGGLRLFEESRGDLEAARGIAAAAFDALEWRRDDTFYAVGGTWRALARLHMAREAYPLHIQQGYVINDPAAFLEEVERIDPEEVRDAEGGGEVSKSRRPLVPIGAMLLRGIVARMDAERIVISGAGVREGYLYDQLGGNQREDDPLIAAAVDLATLNSRDPRHGRELAGWTEATLAALGIEETAAERRARIACCLLTDIAWRANPDYRSSQALRIIAFGAFLGADHQTRMMMGLAIYFRYAGLKAEDELPDFASVATEATMERARLLGAIFRVAYLFSGAQSGVVPSLRWVEEADGGLALLVPSERAELIGDRPSNRLSHLARLTGRSLRYVIGG